MRSYPCTRTSYNNASCSLF